MVKPKQGLPMYKHQSPPRLGHISLHDWIDEYYRPRQGVLGGLICDEVEPKRFPASLALWLAFEDVHFCWNEIREDCPW